MNDALEQVLLDDIDEIFSKIAMKALEKDITLGYICFSQHTWETFREALKRRIRKKLLQAR